MPPLWVLLLLAPQRPRGIATELGILAEQGGPPCVWADPNYLEFPRCYQGVLMGFPFASSCRLLNVVITDAVDTMCPVSLLMQWTPCVPCHSSTACLTAMGGFVPCPEGHVIGVKASRASAVPHPATHQALGVCFAAETVEVSPLPTSQDIQDNSASRVF